MEHQARPLNNPFAGNSDYNCFGCNPGNEIGLKLRFELIRDEVVAHWDGRNDLEGYPGVIHGGIQATIADEAAAWFVYAVFGTAGVTTEIHAEFRRPAGTYDGPFTIRASGNREGDRRATIAVRLENAAGDLCSVFTCVYALFSEEVSRRRFAFPGRDAFIAAN